MGVVEEAGPSKRVSPGLADGVLEHKGTPIWRSALSMGWQQNIGPALSSVTLESTGGI